MSGGGVGWGPFLLFEFVCVCVETFLCPALPLYLDS